MENPVIKIFRSFFSKKNIGNFRRNLNKKTIITGILTASLLTTLFYFGKPVFVDYNLDKQIIEKKINNSFKLNAKIKGEISYKLFPSPRLEIEKVDLNFSNSKKKILLAKAYVIASPFGINNSKNLKFKKFFIFNQTIKIYPEEFDSYFEYFTILKEKNIIFKNCKIFFSDDQNNKVLFADVNLKETLSDNKHQITIDSEFSKKKIKFKFTDKIKGEKNLKLEIPSLGVYLDSIFEPTSTLKKVIGKSQIKLFDSIITVNFEGKERFKIYESFFRNKFLNSKIDGEVSFVDNFFFDLNLGVNQINLRKLILYYFSPGKNYNFLTSGVSKKINGKFEIYSKNINSFIGRMTDTKMSLVFENGDIKIENGSAILPHDSKVNFNILHTDNQKEPLLDFSLSFYSNNANKFLRKFNIYDFADKETSLLLSGTIDLVKNKIKFKNVVIDNREKLDRIDILNLEKKFNESVLDKSVLGILDFFKLKKFAKEISG